MPAKETIPTQLMPPVMPKRPLPAEKAQELLHPRLATAPAVQPASPVVKITTKILSDQVKWLREQANRYGIDHPRAPRLTMEELMQIALDELRRNDNLDELIRRYRS